MGVSTYSKPISLRAKKTKSASDGGKKMKACHILVKHKDSRRPIGRMQREITRSREEALELIEHFRMDIESGQRGFQEVAREFSDCSSSATGGDLGWFEEGQMQTSFEEAARGLKGIASRRAMVLKFTSRPLEDRNKTEFKLLKLQNAAQF